MDESTERELRQFRLMEKVVLAFLSGQLSIERTLAGLRGLLSALKETPEDWTRAFKEEWNVLKLEHASALDRGVAVPDSSVSEIKDVAERMLAMTRDRIGALDRA